MRAHPQYPRGQQIGARHQPSAHRELASIVQTHLKRTEMEATIYSPRARLTLCSIWRINGSRMRVRGCEYAAGSLATMTGGPRSNVNWRTVYTFRDRTAHVRAASQSSGD